MKNQGSSDQLSQSSKRFGRGTLVSHIFHSLSENTRKLGRNNFLFVRDNCANQSRVQTRFSVTSSKLFSYCFNVQNLIRNRN